VIDVIQNYVAGILLVIGALFALVAAIGVVRLPDFYTRTHAASKAGTVGSGILLVALAVFADDQATVTRALAGVAFFVLTAPVSSHLLAKAAHNAGYPLWSGTVRDDMARDHAAGTSQADSGDA
jgi:multicomponent Na+:H+ antiporter subunit G